MTIVRELVTLLRYSVDRNGLTEYAQKARTVGQQVSGVGRAAMQGWREGVRQALGEYGLVPGKLRASVREQARLNREQRTGVQNVRAMGNGYSALGGYIRAALAGVGVMATAALADEWAGVNARIGLATDSADEQRVAMDRLFASAQAAGQDFLSTGDLFTSLSRNRKELGLELDDSLQLTDTIGKLLTIGGGSSAGQQAALTQLGQALASGTLRGDELNSILEQAPRLAQGIADSFGVSVGQLRELGKAGKLTSKQLADGLLKLGESINEEFERMPKTFGRGATLIRNAWGRLIYQMNRATAASEAFYRVAELISKNLIEIVKIGTMALLAAGALKLRTILAGVAYALRLLGLRFLMVAGRVGVVRAAMLFLARTGRSVLWPFLRMFAILETIRLIGDDIITWLKGGESVLGGIIGRSEEWKTQIDAVKGFLGRIKDVMGGAGETLAEWATKWGTIGTVIAGLVALIGAIPTLIIGLVAIIITYWDEIRQAGVDLWEGFTQAASDAMDAATKAGQELWDTFSRWGSTATSAMAKAGKELWEAITSGAKQSWATIKSDFQAILNWFRDQAAWLKSLFAGMMPDWLAGGVDRVKGLFGVGSSTMQRSGGQVSSTDNRSTTINIQGVPGNPAAVGKATEQGVNRGFGPAVPVVGPNYWAPNAEAMP